MSKYQRGPLIPDLETLVFCLQANSHIYHGPAILPACQLFTWPLNKLREKVKDGKLFFAELQGGING